MTLALSRFQPWRLEPPQPPTADFNFDIGAFENSIPAFGPVPTADRQSCSKHILVTTWSPTDGRKHDGPSSILDDFSFVLGMLPMQKPTLWNPVSTHSWFPPRPGRALFGVTSHGCTPSSKPRWRSPSRWFSLDLCVLDEFTDVHRVREFNR